ncbi:MAG TPA: peptidoglycan-associated lipoprotein Pal [Deltaproteobacteria bacterium]|nr:peptidoglycan-associated lipoprotein Pal [Deltaproteobacteria bacterium]HPR56368.1 peptidoglycan-associated lipoprotein Pal [Deltaproteobacteria bacterium]HXK48698.1 peptidoglycan-associated lipoprotein Pal [Deltaproteobacteria bacterium]
MRCKSLTVFSMIMLCTVLFLSGCPKKALEPVGTGMPQPQQPAAQGTTPGEPTMQMEPSMAGAATGAETGKTGIEQARIDFESGDIYFEYDSFDLTAQAKKVLADKASFLNAHPAIKVTIEGHCDERGTAEYNLALGERRAKAAQEYLVFLGVGAQRLSTISYGEEKPVDPGNNEAAWAKNRRAHFVVTEG